MEWQEAVLISHQGLTESFLKEIRSEASLVYEEELFRWKKKQGMNARKREESKANVSW